MEEVEKISVFPSGTYWIGDPSYALSDDDYDKEWGEKQGFFEGEFEIRNKKIAVHSTFYGDGDYESSIGIYFAVDAGVISIMDKDLVDKRNKNRQLGHFHTFENEVHFYYHPDGTFVFIDEVNNDIIMINTGLEEEKTCLPMAE
jgi:hypothetical protein